MSPSNESLYGEKPIVHGYFGYCAAQRLLDTIEEYGLDDMTAIRDALRNGTQETELGTLEFIDGDADRPTIWSKYDIEDGVFHAVLRCQIYQSGRRLNVS